MKRAQSRAWRLGYGVGVPANLPGEAGRGHCVVDRRVFCIYQAIFLGMLC